MVVDSGRRGLICDDTLLMSSYSTLAEPIMMAILLQENAEDVLNWSTELIFNIH